MKTVFGRIVMMAALIAALGQTALAQTADEVAEKYLTAIGGRTALGKIKSRHVTGTATFTTPVGEIPGTIEVFNQAPNKSRSLITLDLSAVGMGRATIDQRFDGVAGYALDSLQGNHEITGNQLENLGNASFPSPFLTYKEHGATLELVRKEKVGDRDAYVLLLKPKSGSAIQSFIDAESFLMVKMIVVVNVPQTGGDVQQITELSDYRDVGGVKTPFQLKSTSSVQSYTVNVTKVEDNAAIDDGMFSKPGIRRLER